MERNELHVVWLSSRQYFWSEMRVVECGKGDIPGPPPPPPPPLCKILMGYRTERKIYVRDKACLPFLNVEWDIEVTVFAKHRSYVNI